jgi:tRNA-2-methylthio-N6-dimethylallyladenosine synthase
MKRAYIKTFGCQMNEQDSAQMFSLLKSLNYSVCDDPLDADFILLNTCSIREKAVHKVYSDLGRLRPIKENRPDLIVGVAGCVAEQEKEKISRRFPFLDMVFGPDHIRHLPQMLAGVEKMRAQEQHQTLVETGFDLRKDFKFLNVLPVGDETPIKAFVNIQKGCDNICSFCIVPFVRGREVSRPYPEIIEEIQQLVEQGVKEVTLLGQNVNSYGLKTTGGVSFAQLLELIAKQTKLKRLRFTTSHPKDVKDDLIEQFVNNPILVPHFHLPVQSGSTRVLEVMRRQYSRAEYLDIIFKLKNKVPGIRFSSDIIVGFPTETDAEFRETLSLMAEVRYDQIFSFVYSPRPYTSAVHLKDDVPVIVKQQRLQELQKLDKKISMEQNLSEVGTAQEVLIEEKDEENNFYPYKGRTISNKVVHFREGDYQPGDFVPVNIIQANPYSLYGINRV